MKYKYLKITGSMLWGQNEIIREDLGKLKQRQYDAIINVITGEYFDVDSNSWKEIEGQIES